MTRLDLFRTMPPEKLARILLERLDGEGGYCRYLPQCEKALDEDMLIPDEWCVECILLWLKEEVKDEDIENR